MKRQIMVFQTVKSFIYVILVCEIGNALFGLNASFKLILSLAAVGGLLSLLYSAIFFDDSTTYDGKMMIDQKQHTLSFKIDSSVEEILNKGEVTLQVDKKAFNE